MSAQAQQQKTHSAGLSNITKSHTEAVADLKKELADTVAALNQEHTDAMSSAQAQWHQRGAAMDALQAQLLQVRHHLMPCLPGCHPLGNSVPHQPE